MKQSRLKCISVLFLLLALTACSSPASSATSTNTNQSSSTTQTDISKEQQLQLISSPAGVVFTDPAITKDGFFEILQPADIAINAHNITFTDYMMHQRIYLSSDPNTLHTDISDTSFIPSMIGGGAILTDQKNLYVVKLGKQGLVDTYGEDGLSKLYRMGLDGRERVEIVLEANQEIASTSAIASENGNLYMLVFTTDEDTTVHLDLMKTDFATKRIVNVCSLDDYRGEYKGEKRFFSLVAAYQGNLLFQQNWLTEEGLLKRVFYKLDTETPTMQQIFEWKVDEAFPVFCKDALYYLSADGLSFYRFDLISETSNLLCEKIAPNDFIFDSVTVGMRSFYPYFFFRFSNDETDEQRRYCWNADTNEWRQETLTGEERDIFVVAEQGSKFLVMLDDKSIKIQDYAPNGAPFGGKMAVAQYALIEKEDYFNGVPNYILFDDMIYSG